jgi:hypothetical protein
MKRTAIIVSCVLMASLQVGCDQDPARSMRIPRAGSVAPASPATALADLASDASPTLQWSPAICPPPAESRTGLSTLVGTGACAFQQQGPATCTLTDDDLLMLVTRPMPDDSLFMIYLGVENFHRGKDNTDAQIVVGVQSPQGLYRWATDQARVTNAADERSVTIAETHLPAVPPLHASDLVLSGTFACGTDTTTSVPH